MTLATTTKISDYSDWGWNIFDFFLVVFSFSEVAISRMLVMNQPGPESSASLNVGPGAPGGPPGNNGGR